jgi:SAM-dependent methyltransferase
MHSYSYSSKNWLAYRLNNEQVKKRLGALSGTVYDLGCGTRPYEADIMQSAEKYIGVDWTNTLHQQVADIMADLNDVLPIPDSVADNVVSFQVLEHLSEPQIALNQAFRILKNGGGIFISVPFQWHVHEEPWDFFRYTKYGLAHMLQKSGFSQIEVEAVSGFWTTWVLKLNYQLAKLIRGPRPARALIRLLLIPIWFTDQCFAAWLDKCWPGEGETAWYFATARKP